MTPCPDCSRIRLLIRCREKSLAWICDGDERAVLADEIAGLREELALHMMEHGAYWREYPWVEFVLGLHSDWDGRRVN